MYWGAGSSLGILAIAGYLLFASGAILLWTNRPDVPIWVNDEFGAVRRNLVRHIVFGAGFGLREELKYKAPPTRFCRCLARSARRKINRGAILLALGPLLFLLDFLM